MIYTDFLLNKSELACMVVFNWHENNVMNFNGPKNRLGMT